MKVPAEYKIKLTGQYLGNYLLQEKIWQGATSTVYRAQASETAPFGRTVAVKVLHPYRNSALQRRQFFWEASLMKRLRHPNIVRVYSSGRQQSLFFFFMEFVNGRSLRQYLAERTLTLKQCLFFVGELAKALNYIHGLGIVHRDLKPENILISNDLTQVKLIDFGYAGYISPRWWQTQLLSGGTEPYLAPEVSRGERGDHRADIFSFGVIIRELLLPRMETGQEALEAVVQQATHPLPWKRYSTAGHLLIACYRVFQPTDSISP
ncbi:MAG: serine/threonine protein kinase [Candidatus Omnitrophica bacterium]|nr:serine/threonine protein kinase [Candidatus Omnitrophota bacterium]